MGSIVEAIKGAQVSCKFGSMGMPACSMFRKLRTADSQQSKADAAARAECSSRIRCKVYQILAHYPHLCHRADWHAHHCAVRYAPAAFRIVCNAQTFTP